MRFKNNTRFILSLGPQQSLPPFAISREFSQKEIDNNVELQSRLLNKHISEYTGEVPKVEKRKESDIRYEVDPTMTPGKLVNKASSGKKSVQYVVADPEGSDGISMDPEGSVTSLNKDFNRSADYIEEGVDASKFKNGADAMEAELNKEFKESTFDDEDTLSENEGERNPIPDADEAIAADAAQFLKNAGKDGSTVTTAKAMIEKEVTSEMSKINKAVSESMDNGEAVSGAAGKVTDFLKQPLNAKKFMIAKETDASFLKEVDMVSQSETVKQLVKQRLEEIK
jgi:hypothetical protein